MTKRYERKDLEGTDYIKTHEELIEALKEGKLISHYDWYTFEWIQYDEHTDCIYDERGNEAPARIFMNEPGYYFEWKKK